MAPEQKFDCDVCASFALAFNTWRRKNKVPLKQIAQDLGLSISTVSAWGAGEHFPSGPHFARLVTYTGVPPCKLFCVMADKCVPAECLLALSQITPSEDKSPRRRTGRPHLAE